MLKLSGRIDSIHQQPDNQCALLTITTDPFLPLPIRNRFALLTDQPVDATGYASQLISDNSEHSESSAPDTAIYRLPPHFNYLKSGDIIYIDGPRQFLNTLFRKGSQHNSILLTEQCNNYCLMCSQPPKERDDSY